jgi:hypothetical protein
VQAIYQNHQYSRPGYGLLLIHGLDGVRYSGDVRFRLERIADHLFLANSGWGKNQQWLAPSLATFREGEMRLLLGPSVVNQLEINAGYRLYLDFGDGSPEAGNAVFQITEIMQSTAPPETAASPPPPPPPQAEDKPGAAEVKSEEPQRPTAAQPPETPEAPELAPQKDESAAPPPPSRRPSLFDSLKPMRTLLFVIIVIFTCFTECSNRKRR